VSGDGGDNGLFELVYVEELSYFLGGLIPVHNGHLTIHQNQTETTSSKLLILCIPDYNIQSFLAIFGTDTTVLDINLTYFF
jgi:hypothetical protein